MLRAASAPLERVHVTGFVSPMAAMIIYSGSTFWFLFLIGYDVVLLQQDWKDTERILYASLTVNVLMFFFQTWNVLVSHFLFWPVVSLYYTFQLTALGLSTALLATTTADSMDKELSTMGRLLAQCLFTGSQLAVTLEYLYRSVAPPPLPTTVILAPVACPTSSPRGGRTFVSQASSLGGHAA